MPNHIKSKIEIQGSKEELAAVLSEFSTNHERTPDLALDGDVICTTKRDGDNDFDYSVGWLNEETGIFRRRDEEDVKGIPDGFTKKFAKAFIQFPDFNKVIPQPENIFNGDLGEKEREMCRREGRPNWLDWNTENWGTKWGSYSCEKLEENIFTFETAWSSVKGILKVMSSKFPTVTFVYEYSDEDTGSNCGKVVYLNGETTDYVIENGSNEAYEMAFRLRPDIKDRYEFVDGEYQYKEDED